jgi:hypothetical protein
MHIEIQGNYVKVHGKPAPAPEHQKKRGKITSFSNKSRKRLLDIVARLNKIQQALFCTLTYGQRWPSEAIAYKHLKAFVRRVRARFPHAGIVWRKEYQQRGAIHFHLIIFNVGFIDKNAVARAWADIIGDEYCDSSSGDGPRPPFTRIERLQNKKKAMLYCAKYVAKVSDASVGSITSHIGTIGRTWGIFNRKCLNFATLVILPIKTLAAFDLLATAAKQEYRWLRFFRWHQSFSLYCDNITSWFILWRDGERAYGN